MGLHSNKQKLWFESRGPFLESPGKFSGPKSQL